jgi:transcriptional regulator with XRE-family HTH domain
MPLAGLAIRLRFRPVVSPSARLKGLVGQRVRAHRQAANRTQRDLAKAAGLNDKYFGRIERGKTNTRLDTLARIAHELQVDPHELLRPFDDVIARSGVPDGARIAVMLEQLDPSELATVMGVLEGFTRYRPRKRPPRR